jgi:lipid A 4'-phosphatase
MEAAQLKPLAQVVINLVDYSRRCQSYVISLVSTPLLHGLAVFSFIAAILFVVFPGLDLGVAHWFFDPPRSFSLGDTWIGRFFDGFVHYAMEWFLPVIVGVYLYGAVRRRPVLGFTTQRFLFVVLSIALSAGLLTNVILKDSWGRARPSQVVQFGGPKQFSPPFMRSSQCTKNCSFVSGDASLAASFVSLAIVADRHRRRWWIGILSFTAVVGLMRMARGSHFLSDVVFGVTFTLMIVLTMERLILERRWRDWPRWRRHVEAPEDMPEQLDRA